MVHRGAPGAIALAAAVLACGVAAAERVTVTFDAEALGPLPAAFRPLTSDRDDKGEWRVIRAGETRVLTQHSAGRRGYRLAILEHQLAGDLSVGVRLRAAPGGEHAGGVAWHVQDAGNYYAARLDLDEHEFVLHKFVAGNRIRLSRLDGLRLDPAAWHEISVQHAGDKIRAWLNGVPVASERDATFRGGRVALWMPADSSCHFARLWLEPLRRD